MQISIDDEEEDVDIRKLKTSLKNIMKEKKEVKVKNNNHKAEFIDHDRDIKLYEKLLESYHMTKKKINNELDNSLNKRLLEMLGDEINLNFQLTDSMSFLEERKDEDLESFD